MSLSKHAYELIGFQNPKHLFIISIVQCETVVKGANWLNKENAIKIRITVQKC